MIQPQPIFWERGIAADTPTPPLVDPTLVEQEEQPLVALSRRYGPIFRLHQSENELARIILAGPEANVFVARHEDDFFTTREQWESFDAHMSREVSSAVKARDGAAKLISLCFPKPLTYYASLLLRTSCSSLGIPASSCV